MNSLGSNPSRPPGSEISAHFRGQAPAAPVHIDDEDELSLRDYYEIVMRYRWLVSLCFIIGIAGGVAAHFLTPKKYSASTSLIRSDALGDHRSSALMRLVGSNSQQHVDFATYEEMISSSPLLNKAIQKLPEEVDRHIGGNVQLNAKEVEFLSEITPDTLKGLCQLKENIESETVFTMNSTLKEMPLLPAIFCNVVSDALLSKLENDKKRKFHIQIKNLEATIERNQIDMEQLESQTRGLFASQQQTHLIYSDDQLIKMMERTESELERAQLHIVMLEDEIASFRGEFELGTTPLKDVEWIATTTPLYIKLKNLELTRGELLTRYKAANPSVKKIDHQIEAVKKTLMPNLESGIKYIEVDNMRRELVSELISLQGQREAAIKRVSFFENELNQQQAMLSQPSPQQRLLRQNTEELNVLKRVHVDSHKALHTAKMQLLATRSGLDILERASADFYSKSTGLAKLIVLGIILGMGIGVGSCFLLNNWSNTLKNTIDIKRQFHLSIMGAIPHWNNDEKYIDEMEPDSQIAEVYSVLRNNIRFSPLRGAEKSLLVVSPSQSEGKTLTAINLALSFALEGSSCLLISADLRRPYTLTQFRQTKDTKRTKGICEYLNEEANIDDAIFKSNFNNLDLVPTCARAKNPTKLLKSERFKALVEKGKADYDIVIIDSPAILPVVDTSIISSHVNAALFVAKADKTATHDIENSLSRLEHVNCPIVGIALNGIKDLKLEAFYGYGRSQYSGYYT